MASGDSAKGSKQRNASLYSASSSVQYDTGSSFVETLDLNLGDKVLDMGCGTGELTKYIAGKVGSLGEVVGIDPDSEKEIGFLDDYQAYYDLHFSNHVFQWLDDEQKAHYVNVAYRCLKPGGIIAVQSVAEPDDEIDYRLLGSILDYVKESSARDLLIDAGFTDVDVRIIPSVICYSSYQSMVEWFIASCKTDINDVSDKKMLEEFKMKVIEKDGTVKYKYNLVQIKERKL